MSAELVSILASDPDVKQRRAAAQALAGLAELPPGAIEALLDALESNACEVEEIPELWRTEPPGWGGVPQGRSWPLAADAGAALHAHVDRALPAFRARLASRDSGAAALLLARGACFGSSAFDLAVSELGTERADAAALLLGSIARTLEPSRAAAALFATARLALARQLPWAPSVSAIPAYFEIEGVRDEVRAAWARGELAELYDALAAAAGADRSPTVFIAARIAACLPPAEGVPLLTRLFHELPQKRGWFDPRGWALASAISVGSDVVRVVLAADRELYAWAEQQFPIGLVSGESPGDMRAYALALIGSRRVEDAFVRTAREDHWLHDWVVDVLASYGELDVSSKQRVVDALVERQLRAAPGDPTARRALIRLVARWPDGAAIVVATLVRRWQDVPRARGAYGVIALLGELGPRARDALPGLEALRGQLPHPIVPAELEAAIAAIGG